MLRSLRSLLLRRQNPVNGGYDAYFWTGVVCLIILFALPFAFRVGQSILGRTGLGVGFAIFGGGVWLAGVFAANFRIICALF